MKIFLTKYIKFDVLKYLTISYFGVVLNLLLNIITIKFLSVKNLGKVTLGKSIFQSFEFAHFGIRFGLDRHLPQIKNRENRIEVFGTGFIASIILSALFTIFWAFYSIDDVWFYSTFYVSGFLYALITIYRIFYRAEDYKAKFINITLIVSLLPIVFQIIGFLLWGIKGLIISALVGYLLCFVIVKLFFEIKFKIRKLRKTIILKKLTRSGITLFVSSVVTFFATIGDRFFIEQSWGLEVLGIFSVIMFVFSVFNIFAVSYTEMIMNQIVQTRSFKFVCSQVLKIMMIVLVLSLISYFTLPFFVNLFIPKYSSYNNLMKLILLGAIPFSCVPILNHYLHSIDKRPVLLAINILCTTFYFVFLWVILKHQVSLHNLIVLKNIFYYSLALLTFGAAFYFSKFHKEA